MTNKSKGSIGMVSLAQAAGLVSVDPNITAPKADKDPFPEEDDAPWSAHHLPEPKTSPTARFLLVAVGAVLMAIVVTSAVLGPTEPSGTRMGPTRSASSAEPAPDSIRSSALYAQQSRFPPAHR